jgi:hypothetical protein
VDYTLPNNLADKPQVVLLHCITKAKEHSAKPMLLITLRNALLHAKQRKLYCYICHLHVTTLSWSSIVFASRLDSLEKELKSDVGRGTP